MKRECRHILCRLEWWKWFLFGKVTDCELILGDVNKPSRDIIFERWLATEPGCVKANIEMKEAE